jgi:23S rRNA pseudouridine955/2504/2580 synthase
MTQSKPTKSAAPAAGAPLTSKVETRQISPDEAGLRVDRWFKRHFPELPHGRLEKLLRTGQVRVSGARVKAADRLATGAEVRIPPLGPAPERTAPRLPPAIDPEEAEALRQTVIHRDDSVIVINKPPGLAVQGGTGLDTHLDAMLDALRFDAAERPRLVHRLDRDTSGVLVLGRTAKAAAHLAATFRGRDARKIYWALVVGVPRPHEGKIDLSLVKHGPQGGEKMRPVEDEDDEDDAKRAITLFSTIEQAAQRAAWLAMLPITGRTHQLRAHCVAIGTPIVGDGKYGGAEAFLTGGVSRKLHLHARSIEMPHPEGGLLKVRAPLARHMADTWSLFGFDADDRSDPFPR